MIKEQKNINIDLLLESDKNPNKMSDHQFNMLVERIKEQGFKDAISVVPSEDGKYKIIEGHHRVRAAKYLEFTEVPCFIHDDWDEDKQKFELVKSNVLKGHIDPQTFTEMVNELSGKYSKDIIQTMMGFADEKEFSKLYQEIKKQLPADLKKKLDEAKSQIKTIDDLTLVLNKIYNEHGDTIEYNYMIFDYSSKEQLWIRCNKDLWTKVRNIENICRVKGQDINDVFQEFLK
jgi:hypothetical protein